MGLNLDVDDSPTVYADALDAARQSILKNRTVQNDWRELMDQYTFLKDIAREATERGEVFGSLLTAAEGVARAVASADGFGRSTRSESLEAQLLVKLCALYSYLYGRSPVPTRAEWRDAVEDIVSSAAHCIPSDDPVYTHVLDAVKEARASPGERKSTSGSGTATPQQMEDDDGTFVEGELKLFLRRCVSLARRCLRTVPLNPDLREMMATLQHFLSSSTLEW